VKLEPCGIVHVANCCGTSSQMQPELEFMRALCHVHTLTLTSNWARYNPSNISTSTAEVPKRVSSLSSFISDHFGGWLNHYSYIKCDTIEKGLVGHETLPSPFSQLTFKMLPIRKPRLCALPPFAATTFELATHGCLM
jgi:hypothetical protein